MGSDRQRRVYRFRQLPLHLEDCGQVERSLASIAPVLGAVDNIRVFSLAKEKWNAKTATVTFKTLPSIFDNDEEQWTLQAEALYGQNVIVDVHFRGFTVLNEPRLSPHTADCIAISGLASHPFGSWKYRERGSHFMWLRDRIPRDMPQLRSLIYGYDTKLSRSRSFQDLDDIARSFIVNLKEIRRSILPPAGSLLFLAHSLGGIVLKRALVLLANDNDDGEKAILASVRGLVFFGVPHRGMENSHFLAMAAKQPNEDLISWTLSPNSPLLLQLDKEFSKFASRLNLNIKVVYETAESPLIENPAGEWTRSKSSHTALVNKESAIPLGTPSRQTIPVNEDHSNLVKFGESDPVCQAIMSFLSDLSEDTNNKISSHSTGTYPLLSQTLRVGIQDPIKSGTVHLDSVGYNLKGLRTISTVPFSRDPSFVGRQDILAQLKSELADPKSQNWASLYGLGGIGKSQIAIEYLYRQEEQCPQISTFWVHASSKARVEQSFTEIATKAKILGTEEGKANILLLVSKWLAEEDKGPWLMVLDNADDATVLLDSVSDTRSGAASLPRRLLDFLPRVRHGAVIVTTRNQSCALDLTGYRGTPIEVLSMTLDDSVELLRIYLPGANREEASDLVRELEKVPLAITQAGAYIKGMPTVSIIRYLELFRESVENKMTLLNKDKQDFRRDGEVPNAVIASWELSFNQIREKSPGSASIMSLMSYLNRQAIPQRLLQGEIDEISFQECIGLLLSFSLIREENREGMFEMHRLVQIATQRWLRSEGSEQSWKKRAIERVMNEFPRPNDQAQNWPICEVLISHADEVLHYTASLKEVELDRAHLLANTAWYMNQRMGDSALAEHRITDALNIQRQYFDDKSGIVLVTLSMLAGIQRQLGKIEEAKGLQESMLEQRLKSGASEDIASLTVMHNLALSHADLGHVEKAEKLMKHVIEAMERLLAPEDMEFLNSKSMLSEIYIGLGKYEESERMTSNVLAISTDCYGFEHDPTLRAMIDLSDAYLCQNKLEKAEQMIAEAIPSVTKIFGLNHWRTLDAKRLLAHIYYKQHRLNEAKDICMSCLNTMRNAHVLWPNLALNWNALLGRIHQSQGDYVDALRHLKDTVESSKTLRGANHPETLIRMYNLATCYYDMGDRDYAIEMMTEVLKQQRKVLPANHPYTKNSAKRLAFWKGELGESEEGGSGEWETEEEGSEEGGSEEGGSGEEGSKYEANEQQRNEAERSEPNENRNEIDEKEESGRDDIVRNQLAKVSISSQARQEFE